jgi:hypothetical protein
VGNRKRNYPPVELQEEFSLSQEFQLRNHLKQASAQSLALERALVCASHGQVLQ